MRFPLTNDATYHRENRWHELWPATPSANDSHSHSHNDYADFALHDYTPAMLAEFGFEGWISYGSTSTVYRNWLHASTAAVSVYLLLIVAGQRWMRERKPMDLKRPLAAWNLLLAVYSGMGASRLVTHIIYGHLVNPGAYFVCRNATGHSIDQAIYFWIALFIWSKYAELVDTAFLVLRKKPVNFIHWFHHATVLLYTWHSMAHQTNTGIYFAGMNYLVHAIMYFYYFLAALGKPPNWGLFVTVLQIAQMFAGIGINAYQYYASSRHANCDVAWRNLYAAIFMYTAYMALFVQFFVERYCAGVRKVTRAAAKTPNATRLSATAKNGHALSTDKNKTD